MPHHSRRARTSAGPRCGRWALGWIRSTCRRASLIEAVIAHSAQSRRQGGLVRAASGDKRTKTRFSSQLLLCFFLRRALLPLDLRRCRALRRRLLLGRRGGREAERRGRDERPILRARVSSSGPGTSTSTRAPNFSCSGRASQQGDSAAPWSRPSRARGTGATQTSAAPG